MYTPTQQDIWLLQQHIKNPYIQLIICDQNDIYNQLDIIDSVVINDNYSIDVTSDVRRTYNLTLSVDKSYDMLSVEKTLWINKIIYIKYGVHNVVTNTIKWYPFGYFTFTDFTYTITETDYTVQINCIDLVGLYNGTIGGNLSGLSILIPNGEDLWEFFAAYNLEHSSSTIDPPTEDANGDYNLTNWMTPLYNYYGVPSGAGYYWNDYYLILKQKCDNNNNKVKQEDLFWDNKIHHVLKDFLLQHGIPEDRLNIQEHDDWFINYDLEFNINTTIWEVINSIVAMYPSQAYFDNNGIFVFEETPEVKNAETSYNLSVNDFNNLIISETVQQNTTNIYNIIQIFGQTFESNGSFDLNNSTTGTSSSYDWRKSNYVFTSWNIPVDPNVTNQFVLQVSAANSIPIKQSVVTLNSNINKLYTVNYFNKKGKEYGTSAYQNVPSGNYYCMVHGDRLTIYEAYMYTASSVSTVTTQRSGDTISFTGFTPSFGSNENFCLKVPSSSLYNSKYTFGKLANNDHICYWYFFDNEATSGFEPFWANFTNNNYYLFNLEKKQKGVGNFARFGIPYRHTDINVSVSKIDIQDNQGLKLYTNAQKQLVFNDTYQITMPSTTSNGIYIRCKNGLYPILKDRQFFTNTGTYLFKFTTNSFEHLGDAQVYSTVLLRSDINDNKRNQDKEDEGDFNLEYMILPNNPYTIEKIGKRRKIFADGHYGNLDTNDKALENCLYELWHNNHITNQVTLNTIMIPWLQGNEIVDYIYQKTGQQEYYVIKQIQGSVSTWTQTITMQQFESFEIPNDWVTKK